MASKQQHLYHLLGGAAALAAVGVGVQQARKRAGLTLMRGQLRPASTLGDVAFDAGPFTLTWRAARGGWLSIIHRAAPERILWATLPGESFIAAAQGRAAFTERHCHYKIKDARSAICAHQTLDSITAEAGQIVLRGSLDDGLGYHVARYTLTFHAESEQRLHFALRFDDPRYNRALFTYASDPDEHFFGFGEQFSYIDMKGKRLPIWVQEQGIGRGDQPVTALVEAFAGAGGAWHSSYAGVPHYLTSRLRSLYLDTYEYAVFDLRHADRVQLTLFAGQLSGGLLYGDSPAALITAYTEVAGRMPPLPDWIHAGAIVGLQGGTERVRELWAQLEAHGVPLAGFWLQDWVGQRITEFGKQLWWNWTLDAERYPDWPAFLADLDRRGLRVLTYLNPMLADTPAAHRNLFSEALEQGFFVRDAQDTPALVQVGSIQAGLLDLTHPGARAWFKAVIRDEVLGAGAAGWMADYGEGLPCDAQLHSGEPAAAYHNRYPEAWAQLNCEAIAEAGREQDALFFARSGYRQSPGHAPLFWLGDQLVDWGRHDGLKSVVTGLLSGGFSGFSLNHSDIGGFTTIHHPLLQLHRSRELLLRWCELAAFTAVFRTHEGLIPDVNHQVYSDAATLEHFARCAKIYRAWGFYRRQLAQEAAQTGLPIARHLFIHYPDDPRVYSLTYEQFLVGSELLIAPVLDPGRVTVAVYLPAGRWVQLWTGALHGALSTGITTIISTPLGQPAVFYREGSDVGAQFAANLRGEGVLGAA